MFFDQEQLYYILKHEMIHYYHGDLIIRLFSEILRVVYWWNPFVHILSKLIINMQEINVDFKIMKDLPRKNKLDYSACLIKVARKRQIQIIENCWLTAFQNESPSAVSKRIKLMLFNVDKTIKKTAKSIMLSAVIVCLVVFCPNVLIFEPYAIAEEDAEGTFDIKNDNVYYLNNHDGTFNLYLDGNYIATVTELLGEDVKVYNNIEEIQNDKNNLNK